MSSYGLNAGMEMPVPLSVSVNNALSNTSPNIKSSIRRFLKSSTSYALLSIVTDAPDLVVNWIVIGVVRRHKSGEMNRESSAEGG